MGANPYCYFTPYDPDIQSALDTLRIAEFSAGRYEPCFSDKTDKYLFEFGLAPRSTFPSPGACHETIEDAQEDFGEGGTNSILDIVRTVAQPFEVVSDPMAAPDIFERFNSSAPLSDDELLNLFGTLTPTAAEIEATLLSTGSEPDPDVDTLNKRDAFWQQIGRGQSRYIVAHKDGLPDQIFFAGVSFD